MRAFYAELYTRLTARPRSAIRRGRDAASARARLDIELTIAGREPPPAGQEPESSIRPVMPGYFRAVGAKLLRGREIQESDGVGAPGVVVINEAFARLHFPNEDPLGHRIQRASWWKGMPASFEIVGIVADERFQGPRLRGSGNVLLDGTVHVQRQLAAGTDEGRSETLHTAL